MLLVRDFLDDQKVGRKSDAPESPLVSIILPTFCRFKDGHLTASIESILTQSFDDFELLIMDDGSSDGSADLIKSFQAKDNRVIHVRHERNSGLPGLRVNEGIELARGRYLAFQFDDDLWLPHALGKLVAAIEEKDSLCVVVGKARLKIKSEIVTIPDIELNSTTLCRQNRLANNCVIFPKKIVYWLGMYDCHIGMRRLCDWDLWLRYVQRVPFIVIDQVVADVSVGNEGSIGLNVPWDLALFRYLSQINRNRLLTPGRWHDYQIDSLKIGTVEANKDFRRRLYEDQIIPFLFKARHHFPFLEGFSNTLPNAFAETILCLFNENTTERVAVLNNHWNSTFSNKQYHVFFQLIDQVGPNWAKDSDGVLLSAPVQIKSKSIVQRAISNSIPVGLYMEENSFACKNEVIDYNHLALDVLNCQCLSDIISEVDTIWLADDFAYGFVQDRNPRIIEHHPYLSNVYLSQVIQPKQIGKKIRLGLFFDNYDQLDMPFFWDALQRISRKYRNRLSFEFWGLDEKCLPALESPIIIHSDKLVEINKLIKVDIDILLTPLPNMSGPYYAKARLNYYRTAIAGALGIFSNVKGTKNLPSGLTCFKPDNTGEAWYQSIDNAISLSPEYFDQIRQNLLDHAREIFSEHAQFHQTAAAWEATQFHARTRAVRNNEGKPWIFYVFHSAHIAGAETQLWRRLRIARSYGIEPIVIFPKILEGTEEAQLLSKAIAQENLQLEFISFAFFTEPKDIFEYFNATEQDEIRQLLDRYKPALVHTTTFIPSFGQVCQELDIPHVASLYAIDDKYTWNDKSSRQCHCDINHSDSLKYARRWSELLRSEPFCSRVAVPKAIFDAALTAMLEEEKLSSSGHVTPSNSGFQTGPIQIAILGTVQQRKGQLEAIKAVGQLYKEGVDLSLNLFGYINFFPDYVAQCRKQVVHDGLESVVTFHNFISDIESVLRSNDILLSISDFESFPSSIGEAMAAGVLVIATPVGGISELIIDGVSGILCAGSSAYEISAGIRRALLLSVQQRLRIIKQARYVAMSEFHPVRTASDIFAMYNRAIDLANNRNKNIKYKNGKSDVPVVIDDNEGLREPVAPRRLSSMLYYYIHVRKDNWNSLAVRLASGKDFNELEGVLKLSICQANNKKIYLRTCKAGLNEINNSGWINFLFEPITNQQNKQYRLEFRLESKDPDTLNDLYLYEGKDFRLSLFHRIYHKYFRFGRGGELAYRIIN